MRILTVVLLCLASCATTKQVVETKEPVVQEVPKTVDSRVGCAAMGMVFCIRFEECGMINDGAKDLCIAKLADSCKHGKIPEDFDHPLNATKLNICLQNLGSMSCQDLVLLFNGSVESPEECNTM